ncbi:MAG: hypothetical protein IPM79_07715 [Polyangiaceae bacterium]|nr:hypothetical protein [Polyangiaceae bacterium]
MTNERLAVSACDLDDLDLPALDAFLVERAPALLAATSREELGARLGLLSKGSPRVTPTLAGLYLFGKLPQLTFPEWGVGCFASTGTSLLDPVAARADLEGGLAALVAGCVAFVRGHAGEQASTDATEYSESLVREVVVNALVHRDLRKTSRVALRLFVDRLEVWSPGGPPEGVTDLEELARDGGISQPRNPIVASVARSLGLGEQLGRGLHLVLQRGGAPLDQRAEVRSTSKDVLVVLPSRWRRPRGAEQLS